MTNNVHVILLMTNIIVILMTNSIHLILMSSSLVTCAILLTGNIRVNWNNINDEFFYTFRINNKQCVYDVNDEVHSIHIILMTSGIYSIF